MKRKLFSILTALALCLSLCPTWALASGTTGTETGPWPRSNDVTAALSEDEATAVASVTKTNGEIIYVKNLADAFDINDMSRSGATVTLLADVTTESSIILSRYVNFALTLDLNGHTITGSSDVITLNAPGIKLTIRGSGSITTSAGDAVAIGSSRGNLTLEGGTFSSDAPDGHGVYAEGGNLAITGEDVTVDRLGATSRSVSLAGGTYTGNPAITVAGKNPVDLLNNKANAYYRDGEPLVLAELTNPIAGPVTVKACQHPDAGLNPNNDGTHYRSCIYCPPIVTAAPEPCAYVFPETGDNRNTGSCICGSAVTVTVTGTEGLVYDGNFKFPSVTVTRDGSRLQNVTEYREAYSNNRYAGSNASVTVTMGGTSWKGSGTYTQTFSIAKADLEAFVNALSGEAFTLGSYGAKLSELQIYGLTAKLKGTDIPVSGIWKLEGDAIPSVSDSGKEVTATFVPSEGADSCNPLTAPVRLRIDKAAPLTPKAGDLAVTNKQAHTYTYDLDALLPDVPEGLSLGDAPVTYMLKAVDLGGYYSGSGAQIEGQTLTLPIEAVESEDAREIGTVTVIIYTGNYRNMTATINVRSVNKIIPEGAPTLSTATLTYGQSLGSITLSGSMKDGDKAVPGTFTWSSPDNRPAAQEEYAAAWVFTPDDNGKYDIVNGVSEIQVVPASIAGAEITLSSPAYRYDGEVHSPGIASVRLGEVTLTEGVDYAADVPAGREAGAYTVTVTGQGNYTGTAAIAFTINPVETEEIDQKDDSGRDLRLEVETGLSSVPAALENDTRYDTPKKIETALRVRVADEMSSVGENIAVFDVTLQYKDESGTWHNVDPNDFPKNGVTAILPYPDGAGATGYRFTVQHLISSGDKAGEMEELTYELTANGLKCKFSSLSPVAVGYEAEAKPEPQPTPGFDLDWGYWPVPQVPGPAPAPVEQPEPEPEPAQPCDGGADCPSRGFTDLDIVGTWYHEAVDYVLRNGLMSGYGNGLFGPDDTLTRAQFAQILYNRAGKPAVTGGSGFTDVPDGKWYAPAVAWAAANGIVGGYGSGLFGPDDNITREQLAVMLWRYAGSPAATERELRFTDADKAGGYALEALGWAVENGVLNGYGDGRLDPGGLATRAQAAQMLKNRIENRT